MNNNPKISIIVPVYNVEQYLPRCIDNILNQSFADLELLLIDDGSKDKSGAICDEYADKDDRIRVYHKENGGVSSARNIGLENARGEWLAFIDGDDEITEGYFNIRQEHESVDVIIKPYCVVNADGRVTCHNNELSILTGKDKIFRYYVQKRNNALWDKIIKRKTIGTKRFNTNVSIGEDFLFFLGVLPNVKSIAFDDTGSYRYFLRQGSAMQSVDIKRRIEILWQNIDNVKNLTNTEDLRLLQKGIVYKSYVLLLYGFRDKLDENGKSRLKTMIKEMKYSDLKFIDFKSKSKLLFHKFSVVVM